MMNRRHFIETATLLSMGLGLQSFVGKRKTHILTLSFDDGFKKSFYKIAEIHEAYGLKACLNVIAMGHEKGCVKELNLHGLDNEGWGPISTNYLDRMLSRLVKIKNLDILPTGEVLIR